MDNPKTEAAGLLAMMGAFLLTLSYAAKPDQPEGAFAVQLAGLLAVLVYWGRVSSSLSAPSTAAVAARQKRLQAAIPMAGTSGLSEEWYGEAQAAIARVVRAGGVGLAALIVVGVVEAFPQAPLAALAALAQTHWDHVRASYSDQHIFICGVFAAHMLAFWGLGLLYAVLDLTRPAFALPYKIQEGMKVSKTDFLRAAGVALLNQAILLGVVVAGWKIFPIFCPNGFSAELPSLLTVVLQMLTSLVLAELAFYGAHRLLHTEWMFAHIHYIHHTWQAPIAITAIYAHPVEFLLGNVPVVMLGPLLTGSHATVWILYTFISTVDTIHGHSGWHLPLLGSSEAHDYHHWQGNDNLGVLNVLDTYYGTNAHYNASWRKTVDVNYATPDYPVDKILNKPIPAQAEAAAQPTAVL